MLSCDIKIFIRILGHLILISDRLKKIEYFNKICYTLDSKKNMKI